MGDLQIIHQEQNPAALNLIKSTLEATGKFRVFVVPAEKKLSTQSTADGLISFGNFSFDPQMRTLQHQQKEPVQMTMREYEVLFLLLENAGMLVNRKYILTSLWGEESFFTSRSLDLFICNIRKRLHADPSVVLTTIRGEGFVLNF